MPIEIVIKTVTGQRFSLHEKQSITIHKLKHRIEQRRGFQSKFQNLFFDRRRLEDDRSISDYNIKDGDEILVSLRLGASRRSPISPIRVYLSDSESDSEDDDDEHPRGVRWRIDNPEESLCDWTIETHSPNGTSATYHVHKSCLALGRNKCDYFVRLFRLGESDEQKPSEFAICTTCFNFDQQKAADAFPSFLNFLYGAYKASITKENAIALNHLAEYLQCRHLRWYIRRFFEDNLSFYNMAAFLEDTQQFRNEWLYKAIARYCALNVERLDPESSLVNNFDTKFWLAVLSSHFEPSREQSEHLSILISDFCARNYETLDLELLEQLTDNSKMPHIDHHAAAKFMALEHRLLSSLNNHDSTESTNSSLRTCCEAALDGYWMYLDLDKMADSLFQEDTEKSPEVARKRPRQD